MTNITQFILSTTKNDLLGFKLTSPVSSACSGINFTTSKIPTFHLRGYVDCRNQMLWPTLKSFNTKAGKTKIIYSAVNLDSASRDSKLNPQSDLRRN